jgi:hypothetical protein
MRTYGLTLDSNGQALRCGAGRGFALLPGYAPGAPATSRPGSYPVNVKLRSGQVITVVGPHAFYLGDDEAKEQRFDVTDGEAGSSWVLYCFDSPEEGVRIGGRSRVSVLMTGTPAAPTVAVPTAAPTLATDGYPMTPGMGRVVTFFQGTLSTATLYVLTAGNVWRALDDTFDPTGTGTPDYDVREIATPARRFAWVAAAANMTMEINAEVAAG